MTVQQQQEDAANEAKWILDRVTAEGRDHLSADEAQQFDVAANRADRLKRLANLRASMQSRSFIPGAFDTGPLFDRRDLKGYSLLRAIRVKMNGGQLDGLEGEVSAEIAKRQGKPAQGFYFPTEIAVSERRDLTLTTAAQTKQTTVDAANFIEILRNRLVLSAAGATVLTGLQGDLSIPKQNAKTAAYWIAEGNSPTEGAPTITAQVALAPKTVGAFLDLSRKLIVQSSISAETFARNDIARAVASAIDEAGLIGSGSGAEPQGLTGLSGVNSVAIGTNGGAPTLAKLVELETAIAAVNADVESMTYIFNAVTRGKLKTTEAVSSTGRFLWGDNNTVNGYRALVSNALPSNLDKGSTEDVCSAALFGDFSAMIIALWTGLDILVDPYTGGTAGTVRIIGLQDVDIKS